MKKLFFFIISNYSGVYYFETKILSGGDNSYIGVGLSAENATLSGLPGWNRNTYGYHGDDGHIFDEGTHGRGRHYGPRFTTNDVIGNKLNLMHYQQI